MNKQRAREALENMRWDMQLMMSLKPEQRHVIDDAVKALTENRLLDSLRSLLPPGHPLAQ